MNDFEVEFLKEGEWGETSLEMDVFKPLDQLMWVGGWEQYAVISKRLCQIPPGFVSNTKNPIENLKKKFTVF